MSRISVIIAGTAVTAAALVGAGGAVADATPQRPTGADTAAAAGGFAAVTPALVLDSRTAGVAAGGTRSFTAVGGSTGVPTTGVSAVVLNVTVLSPAASGYLTVYPGASRPASVGTLNFPAGRKLSNTAVVPVQAGGGLTVFNGSTKAVNTVIVVTGWFATGGGGADGSFTARGPLRILDSNTTKPTAPVTTSGSIPANGYRSYRVAGLNGVPTAAGGVIVNVTAVAGTAAGYVTVGTGSAKPATNLVNLVPRQTLGTLAVVKLDDDGAVSVFNSSATPVRVVADLAGWVQGDTARTAGELSVLSPAHIISTIAGLGTARSPLPAGTARSFTVAGRGGVPSSNVTAVAVTLTAANAKAAGYLTAYTGTTRPAYSTLAFPAGVTTPGTALVPVTNGAITVFNGAASPVDVVVDVSGFVRANSLTVPPTSTSRYVNDLLSTDSAGTVTTKMRQHGCDDITAVTDGDPRFTLLEFGAQSNQVPAAGGGLTTGVLPPNTVNKQRLTYAQVVTAVQGYIDGVTSCRTEDATGAFTLGVGTSNDGFRGATYTPQAKGVDWAAKVITPLVAYGNANSVDVVGADDIEANFDGTAAEVKTWVTNFLAGNTLKLVNNGSAPGCPSTFGQTGTSCQPVAPDDPSNPPQTWTQTDYVAFSRGLAPTRISVLPQIYHDEDAVRWENMSLTSVAAGGGALAFEGVLTQYSVCGASCGNTPGQGWAVMRQALDGSTVTSGTSLPTVSDIDYDS